jgi:hypothetical protein
MRALIPILHIGGEAVGLLWSFFGRRGRLTGGIVCIFIHRYVWTICCGFGSFTHGFGEHLEKVGGVAREGVSAITNYTEDDTTPMEALRTSLKTID